MVIVKTNYPIKHVLRKPKLARWMVALSIEFYEFDLQYETSGPVKTQFMTNFLAKFSKNDQTTLDWWRLYVDNAFNVKGSGTCIILGGLGNVTLEQALKLNFKALNNRLSTRHL